MRRLKQQNSLGRQPPAIVEGDDPFNEPPSLASPYFSMKEGSSSPRSASSPLFVQFGGPPVTVPSTLVPTSARSTISEEGNQSSSSSSSDRIVAANPSMKFQRVHAPRHGKRAPPLSPAKRRIPARRKREDEGDGPEMLARRRRKFDNEDEDDDDEGGGEDLEVDDGDHRFTPLSKGKARALDDEDGPIYQVIAPTLDEDELPWITREVRAKRETRGLRPPRVLPLAAAAEAASSSSTESSTRTTSRPSRTITSAAQTRTPRVRLTPSQITSSVEAAFSRAASAVTSRRSAQSASRSSAQAAASSLFAAAESSVSSRRSASRSASLSSSLSRASAVQSLIGAAESAVSSREGLLPPTTTAPSSSGTSATGSGVSVVPITTSSLIPSATSTISSTATPTISSASSMSSSSFGSGSNQGSSQSSSSSSASTSASGTAIPQARSSNTRLRSILIPAIVVPIGLLLLAMLLFICQKRRNKKPRGADQVGAESSWGGSTNYGATGAAAAGLTMAGGGVVAGAAGNQSSGSNSANPSQDSFGTSPSAIGVAYSGAEPRSKWGRRSLVDVIAGGARAASDGQGTGGSGSGRGRGQIVSTSSSFGGGRQPSMTGLSDYSESGYEYQPGQMRPVTTPSILGGSLNESSPQTRHASPQHYDPFAPTIIPVAAAYAHRSSSGGLAVGDDGEPVQRDHDSSGSFQQDDEYDHDPTRDSQLTEIAPAVPWTAQSGLGFLANSPRPVAPAFDRAQTGQTVGTVGTAVTALTHQGNDSSTSQEAYYTDMAPSGAESGSMQSTSSDEELIGTPHVGSQPVDFGSSGSSEGAGHGSGSSRASLARGRAGSVHSDRSNPADGTPRLGMGHGVRRGDGSWW